MFQRCFLPALLLAMLFLSPLAADDVTLQLRYQTETKEGSGRYHRLTREETWNPRQTALIVCDVWDLHHCLNAVRRAEELGPRLNEVVEEARRRGITIIHAPSDCMAFYHDHPARLRAIETPKSAALPEDITSWCSKIPAEERGVYPIDQSEGGEDDDPQEHAEWAQKLAAMGRNPKLPWKKQSDLIKIDAQRDFISDKGDEVWSILEQRGIENVILTGVHTNMCVLGRPFGLRQMAKNGKNVVLMRDMTDTMYNPQSWPYVSHFTGTDLIVSHIEKFVAPTITSDQLIGGKAFRHEKDTRPHLAIVMADDEYQSEATLPAFAGKYLGKQFRVSLVFGNENERNDLPGLEVLHEADLALFSVRRRVLPAEQLAIVKKFVADGKPVIGLRTASHAFAQREGSAPEGHAAWPEFDAEVLGGNYTGHHGNKLESTVTVAEGAANHAILKGIGSEQFPQAGSLYKASPLQSGATPLLTARIEGHPAEPVAWTFTRADGGRSFYTSLGHPGDFERPEFIRLLVNGICWSANVPAPAELTIASRGESLRRHWSPIRIPSTWQAATGGALAEYQGPAWYRCAVRLSDDWIGDRDVALVFPAEGAASVWWNGHPLVGEEFSHPIARNLIEPNDANLLVVRLENGARDQRFRTVPRIMAGDRRFDLEGVWQFRVGDDPAWSGMPLPAKFGASADVVFEPAS